DRPAVLQRWEIPREIDRVPGSHLPQPDVELAGLVGEEGDELPVGGYLGACLVAWPIREQRKPRIAERIASRRRSGASHEPRDAGGDGDDGQAGDPDGERPS